MDDSLTPTRPHAVPVPPSRALPSGRALWPAVPWVLLLLAVIGWNLASSRANRAEFSLRKARFAFWNSPPSAWGEDWYQAKEQIRQINWALGDNVLDDRREYEMLGKWVPRRVSNMLDDLERDPKIAKWMADGMPADQMPSEFDSVTVRRLNEMSRESRD